MRAYRSTPFGLLIPATLVAAAGCVDLPESASADGPSLYAPQVAPTALILTPEAGAVVPDGAAVEMVGRVADADGSVFDLRATWSVNGEVVCEDVTPDASGLVTCEATSSSGAADVELSVEDEDGLTATTHVDVEIEAGPAPTIELSGPETQKNYSDVAVEFTGFVDGEGELSLRVESNQDRADPFEVELDEDGSFTAVATLTPGEHVITAMVTDEDGDTGVVGTTIYVDGPNTAPDCVVLTPDSDDRTVTGDTTTMSGHVDDDDLGPSALRVVWSSDLDGYLGEGEFDTATGMVELGAVLSAGNHALTLTAIDEVGERCQDTIAHVVGEPPTITVIGPSDLQDEGDYIELNATIEGASSMLGGLNARWSVAGELLDITPVDDFGRTSLASDAFPPGVNTVLVQVTDANGWSVAGATELAINHRPVAPVVSGGGTYTVADALVANVETMGFDPEGMPVTHRYEWTFNGSTTSVSSTNSFPAGIAQRDDVVSVSVFANDGRIDSPPARVDFLIGNAAPVVQHVSMSPAAPSSADNVRCAAAVYDADGDAAMAMYTWLADGMPVATGDLLPAGTVKGGTNLECRVQVTDDFDGATGSSGMVVVNHSAPTLDGLALDGGRVFTDDVLSASYTVGDYDNDEVSVEYAWTVNGAPAGNTPTLDGDVWFELGDTVALTMTPVDSRHRGASSTVSAVVADAPIVEPVIAIEGTRTRAGEEMVCAIVEPGYDPDGDAVSHTVEWVLEDEAWTGDVFDTYETGDTIDGADTVAEEAWTCIVTAHSTTDGAVATMDRRIKSAAPTESFRIDMAEVEGAEDTCTGAEAVSDGTLVEPTLGQAYIAMPLPAFDTAELTEVSISLEAAACNAAEGATGTLMWAIVGTDLVDPIAQGTADLAAPASCTCPDAGDVLELSAELAELADEVDSRNFQLVLTIDAASFGVIGDAEDTAASVTFTY